MNWKRFFMYMVVMSLMTNFTMVSVCFSGSEITSQLKNTIDKVISTVNDEALKNDLPARRAILRKTINAQFNYRQMVMRSLAKNWDLRSAEEQQVFIGLFKSLLENSYANKLESFSNEKINYLDEVIKGEYALVKTEVVRKATTIGVDYKLIRENGVWKVYDFVIEDDEDPDTFNELQKLVLNWCTDDNNKNILYKKNGDERYPNFKLYKMIARTVHNNTPEDQLKKDIFKQYIYKDSIIPSQIIINIDELPEYYNKYV